MKKTVLITSVFALAPIVVKAHCPLCTAGAGAAAAVASWLGVGMAVVGVLIGGFALSMGWWLSKLIKTKYFKGQDAVIIIATFLLTIIPIMPFAKEAIPIMISIAGSYGSLLNRTYVIDGFLLGSLLGALIVYITPWISKKISEYRNKTVPFQGVTVTIFLLVAMALIVQVML